jgi:hypothetical protein
MNVTINQTNITASDLTPIIITVLTYIDDVNRIVSMAVFGVYFILVILISELRKRSLLYLHHANLMGFMFSLMYIFFYINSMPNFTPYFNKIFCTASEATWSLLKYLRPYSILVIAFYRLIEAYNPKLFKEFNSSLITISMPIALVWITALILFLSTKYGFETTYGSPYCIDGFSTDTSDVVNYLIVTTVLSMIVPLILITLLLIRIHSQLNYLWDNINKQLIERKANEQIAFIHLRYAFKFDEITATRAVHEKEERKIKSELRRSREQNKQLMCLILCDVICFAASFVLSFRYIIPDFNSKFYYFRQILRIVNVFSQTMIPCVSLYYGSLRRRHFVRLAVKLRRRFYKKESSIAPIEQGS